jgi:hypothetical protein
MPDPKQDSISIPTKYLPYAIPFLLGLASSGGFGALMRPGDIDAAIKAANADDEVRIQVIESKLDSLSDEIKVIDNKLDKLLEK